MRWHCFLETYGNCKDSTRTLRKRRDEEKNNRELMKEMERFFVNLRKRWKDSMGTDEKEIELFIRNG